MTDIVGAFATSHAFAFMAPDRWDGFRARLRTMYRERYGQVPDEPAEVAAESDAIIAREYGRIRAAQDHIERSIRDAKPDAVILIGNDQNENYGEFATPQFAIYTGGRATVSDWLSESENPYPFASELALELLRECISAGFDVVQTRKFQDDTLRAHAHAQVMVRLLPEATIPVVPVFVNAITTPLCSPQRCFQFGRTLASALARSQSARRVVVGVSGGLSHFTFGYPYGALRRPRNIGSICRDFDDRLVGHLGRGDFEAFAALTDEDLLDNGEVEFRQSLTFFGMLEPGQAPHVLEYAALYRAMTGMWAAYWPSPRLAEQNHSGSPT
jgi:hypothetical protein